MLLMRRGWMQSVRYACLCGGDATNAQPGRTWYSGNHVLKDLPRLGTLRGRTLANGVDEFLNIPYAEPPTQNRRFRVAQPHSGWSGTRDATTFGPACMQRNSSVLSLGVPQSEDCLQLNIWSPSKSKGLPVIVWLHSDRNAQGSGVLVNGSAYAERGVVFVSINYRLGALGYYASTAIADENRASGYPTTGSLNGMLDQQLALVWVADKVGNFGGDASMVTLAGGAPVCIHLYTLQSQGLFRSALIDSGACHWGAERVLAEAESMQSSQRFANASQPPGANSTPAETLQRLRALSSSSLAELPEFSDVRAAADGVFVAQQPEKLSIIFRRSLIVGSNTAASMCAFWPGDKLPSTQSDLRSALANVFGEGDAGEIVSKYDAMQPLGGNPQPLSVAQRFINVTADACALCPAMSLAQRVTSPGPGDTPSVYVYELGFNQVSGWQGLTPPFGELPYFLNAPQNWNNIAASIRGGGPVWNDAAKSLADSLGSSLQTFASTSVPQSTTTGIWADMVKQGGAYTPLGFSLPAGKYRGGMCDWWEQYRTRGSAEANKTYALCRLCDPE
eukprot:TRINITY_DN2927_c0_g1_i1.p1 TRINITY_DN2927_c0_g1~~TRINITY_DN2927_c0_g1_i1.p1  ORF type:complete len:561 (+),score=44.11 TRINITY_DN2927_c0_g1_i1:238-1920(+)